MPSMFIFPKNPDVETFMVLTLHSHGLAHILLCTLFNRSDSPGLFGGAILSAKCLSFCDSALALAQTSPLGYCIIFSNAFSASRPFSSALFQSGLLKAEILSHLCLKSFAADLA